MHRSPILKFIKQLQQPIFTTHQLSVLSGKSVSATTQALNFLQRQGIVFKVYKGVWAEITREPISPYIVIPFLLPMQRAYVSFVSALHLYGIIEQIPQTVTLASTAHTKTIHTKVGIFYIHRIAPSFFKGFDWHRGGNDFLIAEPEKALVDCLYLSARKKKQFGYFPELHFPASFSFKKVRKWIEKIPDSKIKIFTKRKLDKILKGYNVRVENRAG